MATVALRACTIGTHLIFSGLLLACGTDGATRTSEKVDTVVIVTSPPSVAAGDFAVFEAEARGASGDLLPFREIAWKSLDPTIGTINAVSGVFGGISLGEARVVASVDGKADTALIQVSSTSPATPFLVENFSTYTSTADLLSNPNGFYLGVEDIQTGQIKLDESVGFGSSSKSMRYDYPDRTAIGGSGTTGRCTDYTISRSLTTGARQHIWVEIYLRFSSNFTVVAPTAWGCTSASELKLVFGGVGGGDGRYNLEMQANRWIFGYPTNEAIAIINSPTPSTILDNQWHRFRFEFKVSSQTGVADGVARAWIDNTLVSNLSNLVINRSNIWGVSLGRNINQGPSALQSIWWGQVRLYEQFPGW